MFKRFRLRRANKSKLSKTEGDQGEVFRQKKTNAGRLQRINPIFSVDSEAGSVVSTTASQSAFEMDDLRNHGVGAAVSVPAIIELERCQQKRQIEELLEAHAEEIADKDDEIARNVALLLQTESKLAETLEVAKQKEEMIADLQGRLGETVVVLESTVGELSETKANLALISSELIQTQHALHETEEQLNIFAQFSKGIYHYFLVAA